MSQELENQSLIREYIISLGEVKANNSFDKGISAFKTEGKIFLLLHKTRKPLVVSLRCDQRLADLLSKHHESVMGSNFMNSREWIDVILTGQVPWDDVKDLMRHSYLITKEAID